jgi:hypothetical protein
VTAFDLIAYNVVCDGKFLVAIDAAHGHYYVSGYCGKDVFLPPCYLAESQVKEYSLPVFGFEDLPFDNYKKLDIQDCLYPAVALSEGKVSDKISALYVRKSQAEEGRK